MASHIPLDFASQLLETLELANRERRVDMNPHYRRMHFVVADLREFLRTVAAYIEVKSTSFADKQLQLQSLYTKKTRRLLFFLLQYLNDLNVCNHVLLRDLESVSMYEEIKGQNDWAHSTIWESRTGVSIQQNTPLSMTASLQ